MNTEEYIKQANEEAINKMKEGGLHPFEDRIVRLLATVSAEVCKDLGRTLFKTLWVFLALGVGGYAVGAMIGNMFVDYDTTDDQINGVRSGMEIHIDHLTGCHYLSRGNNLLRRTTKDGEHICQGE